MRNRPFKFFISCFFLLGISCTQLYSQAAIQANSVTIDNGNNVIFEHQPVRISSFNVNSGNIVIPAGDSIELMVSVNGDSPSRVMVEELPYGLYPLITPISPPNGINYLRISSHYTFQANRFSGGGGLLNDITIWPTKATGGSSTGVHTSDTFHTQVLYIDAAAFRINHGQITGLPSTLNYSDTYQVDISAQNSGIGPSQNPLEFFVKLDDYAPVRLGQVSDTLHVQGSRSLPINSFNLYDYYDYLPLTNQFRFANHSIIIYAQEQGLVNSIEVARFNVDATQALPVELIAFQGERQYDDIVLDWFTQTEVNNSHFLLEKFNPEDQVFENIANITGMGFSAAKQSYQYTDQYPRVGVNTYRLKQVDFDGQEKIVGNTVEVTYVIEDQEAEVLVAYPNPFTYICNLKVKSPEHDRTWIDVLTTNGQLVQRLEVEVQAGVTNVAIEMGDAPAGTYIFQIRLQGRLIAGKMLKR